MPMDQLPNSLIELATTTKETKESSDFCPARKVQTLCMKYK